VTTADTHQAVDAVWRIESPRLIAGLTRITRDVGLAEDLAQEALVAALEQWPQSGVPDKPGAWLMATAKHRALDHFRRNSLLYRKHQELGRH
jgi:predicted RNA polymerase sigma factor